MIPKSLLGNSKRMSEEDAMALVAFLASPWFLAGSAVMVIFVLWALGWADAARRRNAGGGGNGGGSGDGWNACGGNGDGGGDG